MKEYVFYGWRQADMTPLTSEYTGIVSPGDLYDALRSIWCPDTCAPRMREKWNGDNPTLGQCSVTAFLVQDIFGGKVYGIPLGDGNYHCFNVVDGVAFDLTSEQFGDEKLNYDLTHEQFRSVHFEKNEKKQRYELLKSRLLLWCDKG